MRVGYLLGACAALAILASASPASAKAVTDGATIGPVQISALGHPGLCWEAGGNGSAVTLEHCDRVRQGQQWSLTPDGVLMNGNGYCLEAVPGGPLLIDFARQCAGTRRQRWHYRSGQLTSLRTCAATAGPVVPGAEITGGTCARRGTVPAADAVTRWSIGYSAVTLTAGRGRGPVVPAGGTFGTSVTVANAASAQAAYGVSVTFTLPPGVSATAAQATGGPGLHCSVATLTCTGTLPAGAARRVTLTGPVPAAVRAGDSYPIRARATVTGTTQRARTSRTTAVLTVTVGPAATPPPRSPLPLITAAAAVLLLAGGILVVLARRPRRRPASRHRPSSRHRAPGANGYEIWTH